MTAKLLETQELVFELGAQGLVPPLLGHIMSREFVTLSQVAQLERFIPSFGKHTKLTLFLHVLLT